MDPAVFLCMVLKVEKGRRNASFLCYNETYTRTGISPEQKENTMKKLNIAIVGYGRSGCDIHGAFLRSKDNDICNVVAVERLQMRYYQPMRAVSSVGRALDF